MSGYGYILFLATFATQIVEQDTVPTTERWRWTFYYDDEALTSWNDAHAYCFSQNARILKVDEELRHDVIDHFKENEWNSFWGDPVWIGVYYDGNSIKWEGVCGEAFSSSGFSNWKDGEIVDDKKPCTMVDSGEDLEWKKEVCKQQYRVICEEYLGPCVFEDRSAPSCLSREKAQTFVTKDSFLECENLCRTWVKDGEECWAVSYSSKTKLCYGRFDSSPFDIETTEVKDSCSESDERTSFKICFTAASNSSSIPYIHKDKLAVFQNTDCLTIASQEITVKLTTVTSERLTTKVHTSSVISTTLLPTTMTSVPDVPTTKEILSSTTTSPDTAVRTSTHEGSSLSDSSTTERSLTTRPSSEDSIDSSTHDHTNAVESGTNVHTSTVESSLNVQTSTKISSTNLHQSTEESSTNIYTTKESTTTSTLNSVRNSTCKCSCKEDSRTVEEKIELRKKELFIDPKTTSKSKNKLISVHDERESAQKVGLVGFSMILIVFSI